MKKPVLVVMAAGMGSRYGGLKQIDPVGAHGQLIIDYSIYDARRAGFETVVFIIKHEIEETFKAAIGDRLSRYINVQYAYQELSDLPEGYSVPQGRVKPWGTAHAILAARHILDGPFAVINADDYYGVNGFRQIYDFLAAQPAQGEYAMVGYELGKTVTEHGHVARGVCEVGEDGYLRSITERTHIEKLGDGARFTEDDGATWTELPGDTPVSMNLWGLNRAYVDEAEAGFPAFLDGVLAGDPTKGEYYLPILMEKLLEEGKAKVKVLHSPDKWHGVTYQADKPQVVAAIAALTAAGVYPEDLWAEN